MTKYKIILSKEFKKKSKLLDKAYKKKLQNAIMLLSLWLFEWLDIKELQPKWKNTYRLRIWKHRIIYRKKQDIYVILFLKLWTRWDIYK